MSSDTPFDPARDAAERADGERSATPVTADPAAPAPAGADSSPADDLLSQLEVVESQPLAARAAAYEAIHEQLAQRLEQDPASAER